MVSADVEPAKIDVSSGKHAMEKISTLYTEKVPLEGITQSGELKVRVVVQPASAKFAADAQDMVTVRYQVRTRSQVKVKDTRIAAVDLLLQVFSNMPG